MVGQVDLSFSFLTQVVMIVPGILKEKGIFRTLLIMIQDQMWVYAASGLPDLCAGGSLRRLCWSSPHRF